MDLTISFAKRPAPTSEVMQHTANITGREFHFSRDIESLMIRLGPYDNSDLIEIKQGEDGEIMVLHDHNDGTECVLSVLPEEL